jgi:hypothetical protein
MEIKSKESILTEIKNATQRAVAWFDAIPAEAFFTRQGAAWSASDNVDHLIRAIRPVVLALKIPKMGLQVVFGTPAPASQTYDELCKSYETRIAQGGQASGIYLPDQTPPARPEKQKKELLEKLNRAGASLVSALEKWDDAELDQYQLPHPLLGKLTVREMMFFSIYHALRHARPEGD